MNNSKSTQKLVRLALLTAILIVMEVTNIGYIKTPTGLEMTIMPVPVIIGAILEGPAAGAILGGVFGLTSFIQCFGKSAFGAVLLGINPFYTFIVCFVTRVLMGLCCGLIFKALNKDGKGVVSFSIASLSGAFLNTLFFMTALILLFGKTDFIMGFRGSMGVIKFVIMFVGTQGLIEAIVCFVVGAALSKALWKLR